MPAPNETFASALKMMRRYRTKVARRAARKNADAVDAARLAAADREVARLLTLTTERHHAA